MQNPHHQHTIRLGKVEDNVAANLKSSQTCPKRVAGAAYRWIPGKEIESVPQIGQVSIGLPPSPRACRIGRNLIDIPSASTEKPYFRHNQSPL
jgi:hypothetical protein